MSEHIKGPWMIDRGVVNPEIVSKDWRIATVFPGDRVEANARLIAAAPDMLAALQRIDGINDNPSVYNPDIDAVLRAAIAKATGGE